MSVSSRMSWVVYDPKHNDHKTGSRHPEKPERCEAIQQALLNAGLTDAEHVIGFSERLPFPEDFIATHFTTSTEYAELPDGFIGVTGDDVHRVKEYIYKTLLDQVQRADPEGNTVLLDGQIPTGVNICPRSMGVALRVVGGVLNAVDYVMNQVTNTIFCNIRPPGHHACSDKGSGFCLFNNVAIAARYALRHYGVQRVLIVDWDVHHGNGTQDIFYRDPSVFYFSTHQYLDAPGDFYPCTGFAEETGVAGNILNVPIKGGKAAKPREHVIRAFREQLVPAMERFQPELVFISAGFDAHRNDTIGNFDLTDKDFVTLTEIVKEIANQYAGGRIISVLEGGYSIPALRSAVVEHVRALSK